MGVVYLREAEGLLDEDAENCGPTVNRISTTSQATSPKEMLEENVLSNCTPTDKSSEPPRRIGNALLKSREKEGNGEKQRNSARPARAGAVSSRFGVAGSSSTRRSSRAGVGRDGRAPSSHAEGGDISHAKPKPSHWTKARAGLALGLAPPKGSKSQVPRQPVAKPVGHKLGGGGLRPESASGSAGITGITGDPAVPDMSVSKADAAHQAVPETAERATQATGKASQEELRVRYVQTDNTMPCVHQSIQWSGDPPSEERGVSPEYGMGTEEKHAQTEPTPPDCLRGLLQLFAGDGSMVTMNFEAKSKKIHVCIHQGKVAMKVGGGYMTVEEYLTRKINLLASATPDESDHADAKSMAALTSAVGFSVKARRAAHARSEADSVMTAAACRGDASCDVNANTDAASSEKVPHVPGDTITNTAAPISPSPYGNTNLAAQDADRCRLEGSAAEFLLVDSGSQDAPANVVSRQGPPCRRKGTSSRRGSVVHSVDETEAEANLRTLVKPRSAQQPRAEFSVRSENESGESTSFLPVIERQGRSCAFVNERAGSSEKYHRPGPLEGGRDKGGPLLSWAEKLELVTLKTGGDVMGGVLSWNLETQ
eukprot:CAMPEP_0114246568 /NCGR_PEP_ID=MMETSP0058-20121206/12539_1 /TAXON_ID=36894 /ORGANISM="Pyramimonas parkeae, CCMP726" /LENGTH=596 /DNA_ID=CAMNT_0001359777 /DNA_START=182 /DNA_END=1973 /DNA_ORIENTATION=-